MKQIKKVLAILFVSLTAAAVRADVLPDDAIVEGKTIGEWTAEWWKWIYSIPTNQNPEFDADGSFVHNGQSGPVFFGSGGPPDVSGPPLTLSYSMPEETYLLLPILAAEADNIDVESPWTAEQLHDLLAEAIRATDAQPHALVDGVSIPFSKDPVSGFFDHRAMSPVFSFDFTSADNIDTVLYGHPVTGLIDPMVADGYWLMIAPLTPGVHELETGVTVVFPPFSRTLIHRITVVPISLSQRVDRLVLLLERTDLPKNRIRAVLVSLQAGRASFDRSDFGAGMDQLRAFQNKVRAQVAPGDPVLAERLSNAAQNIIDKGIPK